MKQHHEYGTEALSHKIRILMAQKSLDAKSLGTKSKMSLQRLNEYLTGQRKPGVKALKKIARGLGVSLSTLVESSQVPDPRPSRFEILDVFIEALDQLQRRSFSTSQLSAKDYKHLMDLVECLGGWKKVMTVLERELFEAPRREMKVQ